MDQFSIYFTRVPWTSNKSIKLEYGLIKALGVHIKKTAKIYPPPGWEMFSSPTKAETEVLFFGQRSDIYRTMKNSYDLRQLSSFKTLSVMFIRVKNLAISSLHKFKLINLYPPLKRKSTIETRQMPIQNPKIYIQNIGFLREAT